MRKIGTVILVSAYVVFSAACGSGEKKEMSHDEQHEKGVEHHDHDAMHNHDEDHDGDMTHDEMHDGGMDHHDHEHDGDHNHDEMHDDNAMMAVPAGAMVSFANLVDGQKVTSPVKVEFAVEEMEVEPAGELKENKGHHHIIINGAALASGEIVPADSTNIHFGKGQTETELDLPVGTHTLTLQFADGYHRSYGEQMSKTITVTVE